MCLILLLLLFLMNINDIDYMSSRVPVDRCSGYRGNVITMATAWRDEYASLATIIRILCIVAYCAICEHNYSTYIF